MAEAYCHVLTGQPTYGAQLWRSAMTDVDPRLTRRLFVAAAVSLLQAGTVFATEDQVITVHLDPNCGCCSGWVQHLRQAG